MVPHRTACLNYLFLQPMNGTEQKIIKIAILDLYEGFPNQGMRCIQEIVAQWAASNDISFTYHTYNVRQDLTVPDISYDIYISSGGPGSPLESEGTAFPQMLHS